MFGSFRKSPRHVDEEFSDLSRMLSQETENPTYRHELLDYKRLDYSVESLKHIDKYLEALHSTPPQQEELVCAVLRCGAYVGEVIRRNSHNKWRWTAFEEAAKHSAFAKDLGYSLGTVGILWREGPNMCFPLAKICKFIENGNEDSVYSFAKVILEDPWE
jgi:hypothetical protein